MGFDSINALVTKCLTLGSLCLRIGYNPEGFFSSRHGIEELSHLSNVEDVQSRLYDVNAMKCQPQPGNQESQNKFKAVQKHVPTPVGSNSSNLMICYNGQDIGDHFKGFPSQIKRVFCHGCGKLGIYSHLENILIKFRGW